MNHPLPLSAHTLMVRDLLARRRPGYGLEAPFYLSEELFRADMEHIFGAHWIFVAVEPQIAEAGDYVTIDIGSRSILIVRSDDLQIRAFHNVCRHRGSRLCADRQGVLGNIVCPYHQWSYDLTGKLVHAKHMPDDFDFSGLNLRPVHVRSLLGLIFICLSDAPPEDFEQMATAMTPYLAPHQLQQCKVAAQVDLVENCNWKITMENNRECYHCLASHPELTVSLYEHGFGYKPDAHNADKLQDFQEILERSHARWEAMGLPSAEIDTLDERVTGFRTQRLPLDRCGQSQTLNTEVASKKLLADFVDPALGGLSFWTQPNSWHHFMSDHIISFSVLPIAAGKTLVRTTWCVHRDAVEGEDYTVENLTAVWNATNEQDRRLVEESQIGIASGAYEPGPFSPFIEGLLDKFCNWYVQRLSALVR